MGGETGGGGAGVIRLQPMGIIIMQVLLFQMKCHIRVIVTLNPTMEQPYNNINAICATKNQISTH